MIQHLILSCIYIYIYTYTYYKINNWWIWIVASIAALQWSHRSWLHQDICESSFVCSSWCSLGIVSLTRIIVRFEVVWKNSQTMFFSPACSEFVTLQSLDDLLWCVLPFSKIMPFSSIFIAYASKGRHNGCPSSEKSSDVGSKIGCTVSLFRIRSLQRWGHRSRKKKMAGWWWRGRWLECPQFGKGNFQLVSEKNDFEMMICVGTSSWDTVCRVGE